MANTKWTTHTLGEEIAYYYQQYRGTTAPSNTYIQNLWSKWEELDRDERAARA